MAPTLMKVIYKPNTQSTEEYSIIVNPEEYKKWKDGDTTIPLAEVVDSFTIFHSDQGSQGILRQPSNQQLDSDFGTHKDIDVVEFMLKNGKEQRGEGLGQTASTNVTRGSNITDTRSKGLRGI
ncbi:hypothetical protein GALMADRAFT_236570 [Galerina marginata CBS 339.88]|uniref:Ribosome maturation protein SDO1/SBDS N-terminal domain-containing protein n=1 Tax=Galerina marginata (strain CBS 339.88) TaxID=685588 RepID=A0A067TY97_GALM3|nr:hypothetical protein GALMADRAFT_236570 [Galerina marginata CBS 339.88]